MEEAEVTSTVAPTTTLEETEEAEVTTTTRIAPLMRTRRKTTTTRPEEDEAGEVTTTTHETTTTPQEDEDTTTTRVKRPLRRTHYPWNQAVRRFLSVEPQLQDSAEEQIWASGDRFRCGKPCVATCLVGQWRQKVDRRDWSLLRDTFSRFSDGGALFTLWSALGTLRLSGIKVPLQNLRPDRALVMWEKCTTPECFREHSQVVCDKHQNARLNKYFGTGNFYSMYGMCDVQVDRMGQCMQLVREFEHDQGLKFDWVVKQSVDYKWFPDVAATTLNSSMVYMQPWCEGDGPRACYGGFDWWYATPRAYADVISGFRDGVTCDHLDREEIIGKDPFFHKNTQCSTNFGCEGWLAAWLFSQKVRFRPLGCWKWVPQR